MDKVVLLGVSGEQGSFSEEAGILYSQQKSIKSELKFLLDMEGVLSALETKKIDLGIFPVVNSIGGLVTMAFEAMGRHRFIWLGQLNLPIHQFLLAKPSIDIKFIRQIVSHPQGLAQCQKFLSQNFPQAQQIPWQDTAKAAKDLAENRLDKYTAVIASRRCAQIYHLNILSENIQDISANITTFIVVKAEINHDDR